MAASWWKYGLCIFGGLGVGYAVGVKLTKDRAEKETEQEIADIREIFRNDCRSKKPSKEKEKPSVEKTEVTTKTSIQMEKLSQRKEKADDAMNRYSKAANIEEPQDAAKESEKETDKDWKDYIHLVDEIPEDSTYRNEILKYYSDGVLVRVSGQRVDDKDIPHMVGEENLKLLEQDECNVIYVRNDLWQIDYTIIFSYDEWAKVVEEEPYKALL